MEAVLLVVLAAFSIWVYWGNTAIQTTGISIHSEKLPEPFDGFVIAHISDLHNAIFGDGQGRLLETMRAVAPDLIAVTGDLIDSRHTDIERALEFIRGAVQIAPVYYVTGNHESRVSEYPQLEKQIEETGVVILRNKSTALEREGACIRLMGLDDPSFASKGGAGSRASVAEAALKNMMTDDSNFVVLLSHRPELFDIYASKGIDLVLCGHAHGGQVRLPFVGGLVAPNQGVFPQYTAGVHIKRQTNMVVSRGLGNSIAPVRINNRPELVVITLLSKGI